MYQNASDTNFVALKASFILFRNVKLLMLGACNMQKLIVSICDFLLY